MGAGSGWIWDDALCCHKSYPRLLNGMSWWHKRFGTCNPSQARPFLHHRKQGYRLSITKSKEVLWNRVEYLISDYPCLASRKPPQQLEGNCVQNWLLRARKTVCGLHDNIGNWLREVDEVPPNNTIGRVYNNICWNIHNFSKWLTAAPTTSLRTKQRGKLSCSTLI